MTAAPPKITFGHKSVSADYMYQIMLFSTNPQVTTSIYTPPNQTIITQYYEKPAISVKPY